MPEKNIDNSIWIIIIAVPFFATLAKSLSNFNSRCQKINFKDFSIQCFVGTISGFLFGLLGCWIIGNYQGAVGAIAGFGAVAGITSVARMAEIIEQWLIKKVK